MNIIPLKGTWFDDAATLAMGEAFDRACMPLPRVGAAIEERELIARRIIEAAKAGERDPAQLCERALKRFGIENRFMLVISAGQKPSVSADASVTRKA